METIKINNKEYLLNIKQAKAQGLLKEKDNKPRSWEEYERQNEPRIGTYCNARDFSLGDSISFSALNSLEEARAFCALGKLIQLRDAWWGDWRPDWKKETIKYSIIAFYNQIVKGATTHNSYILIFPTKEMRDDFLDTFRDLIEQAKMFL